MKMIDIPIENLAHFLAEDRSAAVWYSPADKAVLGCFVEADTSNIWGADQIREMVSRRPAKCTQVLEHGSCVCVHLCLGELESAVRCATPPGTYIEWFTDYGYSQHPGPETLDALLARWATDMGWSAT